MSVADERLEAGTEWSFLERYSSTEISYTGVLPLNKPQIGKLGELLVQYELLRFGLDSSPMTTDSGVDLVVYSPFRRRSFTIQVKANLQPKPAGGNGALCLDWNIRKDCPAEINALVGLCRRRIWLITKEELPSLAHQTTDRNYNFYMYVDVVGRTKHTKVKVGQFSEYLLKNRVKKLFL